MDVVITYDEVANCLKNPPSLEPRPNFPNICALQKHIVQGLAQLSCPQSAIHGWSGLAMDPAAYLLLKGSAFTIPPDPGPTVVFPGGEAIAQMVMKTMAATFKRDKNYFLSYTNILRACFCMLDANVLAQFKVSNNANLTRWNSTMSIIDILAQLQNSYGKPNMMTIFTNDNLFHSLMNPGDSPEMLFYRLEQCQEVQRIGQVPYSAEQIIANAIRILATSNIFPLKEFNTWEATATKTYPALKTFFQEAYGRRLTDIKLRNTTGQNGYTNNTIYNAFTNGDEDTDNDMVNTIVTVPPTVPQAAATVTMAASSLGTATGSAIDAEVVAAISQLSANQTAIMSQMAAMSFIPTNTHDTRKQQHMFQVPSIQQLAIPVQQSFQQAAFNGGRRGGRGCGRGHGGRGRTPFADHMRMTGGSPAMQSSVFPLTRGGTQVPPIHGGTQMNPFHGGQPRARNPDYSNIYKR
jgi:hypothetical protein